MNPAAVTITTDERTGFPMLALEGLPFRVSWLPLTWVQLEYFLSETANHAFDASWYQALVARTQRGSPAGLAADSVHTLFVRTLRLQEIRMICRWWEVTHWYVPTREEWMALQDVACSVPAVPLAQLAAAERGLNPRALRMLQVLGEVSGGHAGESRHRWQTKCCYATACMSLCCWTRCRTVSQRSAAQRAALNPLPPTHSCTWPNRSMEAGPRLGYDYLPNHAKA